MIFLADIKRLSGLLLVVGEYIMGFKIFEFVDNF
jgi:hypothetical protein